MATRPTRTSTRGKSATATATRGKARAQAAEAAEFVEVRGGDFPPVWDFEEQGDLIGTFTGSKGVTTKHGDRVLHHFDVDGQEVTVWGAAILNSRLEDIDPGSRVKVVLTGNFIPTKRGKPATEYKVYVARGAVAQGR